MEEGSKNCRGRREAEGEGPEAVEQGSPPKRQEVSEGRVDRDVEVGVLQVDFCHPAWALEGRDEVLDARHPQTTWEDVVVEAGQVDEQTMSAVRFWDGKHPRNDHGGRAGFDDPLGEEVA